MELDHESSQVLCLVQALIGAVSSNFRRVTIEAVGECVRLHFLLERESPEDREEIDDVVFEFESLQSTCKDVQFEVLVDERPIEEIVMPGRIVYGRRE